MVYDTDSRTSGSASSSALTRLVLPPPEGELMMKKMPLMKRAVNGETVSGER